VSEAEARLRPLMVASLDGDAAAYRDLLRELTGYLRAYYRCRVAYGAADAEDLIQETLIAIHSRRSSYDRSQPFTAWVYAMARYKLIDYRESGACALPCRSTRRTTCSRQMKLSMRQHPKISSSSWPTSLRASARQSG